jgi:hypothetical protein
VRFIRVRIRLRAPDISALTVEVLILEVQVAELIAIRVRAMRELFVA